MRVGLVVSKRVGNAVVRNTVKRRFREAARLAVGSLTLTGATAASLDIVLLAGPSTPQAAYKDIYNELRGILEKHYAASRKSYAVLQKQGDVIAADSGVANKKRSGIRSQAGSAAAE